MLPEAKRAHMRISGSVACGSSGAHCTFAGLMRAYGIERAVGSKPLRTGFSDKAKPFPKDHVMRQLQAASANRLWVSDFTYVWTKSGFVSARAVSINGLHKTKVIHRRCPWLSFKAVEFATLKWVDWFNNRRLLEPISYIARAEAGECFYAALDQ
jgi:transposase InsO family protein